MYTEIKKRRDFIKGVALGAMTLAWPSYGHPPKTSKMKFGLVTYLWGEHWDIPTLIRNCEKSKYLGVELRSNHKHGVGLSLSAGQRKEVKKTFADSSVVLVGYGASERFDSPDPVVLKSNIDKTKLLLQLSYDIGGSGVKVKPNAFHEGVPHEQTIEQIGRSLNELGAFAGELGQVVRLEVHGQETNEIHNIKAMMDVADNRNVVVCWNSNPQDLNGKGLDYNFNLIKRRFGDTVHVHELNFGDYPYQQLVNLFVKMDYSGWILLESHNTDPEDKVKAMTEQREVFEKMVANALKSY